MPNFQTDDEIDVNDVEIAISERNGVRILHIGGNMIQSAMRISAPNDLELLYTRDMMGFLLFYTHPKQILTIGLGGGSLAKFIYHYMPDTKITVVENNAQVISAAHHHFSVPAEDERFTIIHADGREYLSEECSSNTDILMVDGFDDYCQVPALCSPDFYQQAYERLNQGGILVVNLLSRDKNLNTYLKRIDACFKGHIISVLSERRGNIIVFAMKKNPKKMTWKVLRTRAKKLETLYPLPFSEFLTKLHKYNQSGENFLPL
mgnify:CR=1 FL=1